VANPTVKMAIQALNVLGIRQGRTYAIDRAPFDPAEAEQIKQIGFDLLGDFLKSPSRGLHQISGEQIQQFSKFLIQNGSERTFYADNSKSEWLARQGHVYLYRGPIQSISAASVAFIQDNPNNSIRLLIRTFTKDALELPSSTVERMRQSVQNGARDADLFREMRNDTAIREHQRLRWEAQSPVIGDVMLGHNSIIVNTRCERYSLDNGRYLIDIINPATREFHIIDGSSMWIRIVETTANRLLFAVIGTGKHRYALIDAMNNWAAMTIWHCMALVQQHVYDGVPASYDAIAGHIAHARQVCGPNAEKLYQTLSNGDTDRMGAFMRGVRRNHVYERGDGYL
jgi:hypothetical protein